MKKIILLVTAIALNFIPINCTLYTTISEFQEAYKELDPQRSAITVSKVVATKSDDAEESKETKYNYDYYTENAILALDGYDQAYKNLNSDLLVDAAKAGLGSGISMFIISKLLVGRTIFKTKITDKDIPTALIGSAVACVFSRNEEIARTFGKVPYYAMPSLTKKENLFSYFNTPTLTRSAIAILTSASTYGTLQWITKKIISK